MVILLNEVIHQMEMEDPDLIIVGSQSNSLPFEVNHVFDLTLKQWSFFMGTQPDLYILCVNPQDPDEYICRTISFLESIRNGRVIGLVLFPQVLKQEWAGFSFQNQKLSDEVYFEKMHQLSARLNVPVYELSECGANKLADDIISILST